MPHVLRNQAFAVVADCRHLRLMIEGFWEGAMHVTCWLVGAGLILLGPGIGHAQQPGTNASMAAGDTVMHIVAHGSGRGVADDITFSVPISAHATTAAEARTLVQAKIATLKTALIAKGIDPRVITETTNSTSLFGFIGNAAEAEDGMPVMPNTSAKQKTALTIVQIALTNATSIGTVNTVLDAQDLTVTGGPQYALRNDTVARQAAIADAVAHARVDGSAYANAVGMRVGRIVQVANYAPLSIGTTDFAQLAQTMRSLQASPSSEVTVKVDVVVDFTLLAH